MKRMNIFTELAVWWMKITAGLFVIMGLFTSKNFLTRFELTNI